MGALWRQTDSQESAPKLDSSALALRLGDKALCCIMLHYASWTVLFFLMVWDGLGIMRHYAALCQSTIL